jgi:hypothetical protein
MVLVIFVTVVIDANFGTCVGSGIGIDFGLDMMSRIYSEMN